MKTQTGNQRLVLGAVMLCLLGIQTAGAATCYVSPSGSDANDGSSWALAKKTIQAGVAVASAGATVLVTNGTYAVSSQVSVGAGLIVRSVNGPSVTIVNGNYPTTTNRCFQVEHTAMLDGFTITNGCLLDYDGCGVLNDGTVQNCIISGNNCDQAGLGGHGGGVYNGNNGVLSNCAVVGNDAGSIGMGGGIFNYGMIVNCAILQNKGGLGGGVYNSGRMLNCTISANAASGSGGGIYNYGTAHNCIVYYNANGDWYGNALQYSCAPGLSGTGNISDDPQFVDSANSDYRLKPASPCINTGTNQTWMSNAVDLAGNPRIINSIVDLGAYESTNAIVTRIACPPYVSASDGNFADKIQVTWVEVIGAGGYIVYRNTDSNVNLSVSFQSAHSPYNDTNALTGSNYYYWVVATNSDGNSLLSNSDRGYRAGSPFVPNNVRASDGTFADSIRISWSAVSNAGAYEVWRNTANDSATAELVATVAETSGDDTSVEANHIYYYWIRAMNVAGVSDFSDPDSGYALLGPYIRANGLDDTVVVGPGSNLTVTVEINPGPYEGVAVDWWVVALAGSSWYYLNNLMQWTSFDGNLSNCHPVHQGALFDLAPQAVLNMTGLFAGYYQFWFAVDYPMDGILNLSGPILLDSVVVNIR